MQDKTKKIVLLSIVLVIIIVFMRLVVTTGKVVNKYDDFTKCLGEKGAQFYGAFWCPHCQSQKKLFGRSAKYLPYIECSTPDSKDQTQTCKDKKIEGYPTWVFADESRLSGEIPLTQLAEKTTCELPKDPIK